MQTSSFLSTQGISIGMREQLEENHLPYISLNYDSPAGNILQILPAAPQDTLLEDM